MDSAVQAWLISQLGSSTDTADLEQRYARLGSARAVALEVLYERKAALIHDQPSTVTVTGVVGLSYTENIKAIERQINALESGDVPVPPDEPQPGDDDTGIGFGIIRLIERPRR
ncbi:hypothetical protein [Streptomyces sp. NPDC095613]|uniref:hypothetical protein n=1 Tax=Streptomyces sp. NPDC095613 TaxID=3155540 RepID=UPI003322C17D